MLHTTKNSQIYRLLSFQFKKIVYGHLHALRIYISVNFNNLTAMSKILIGKLQNKKTQEISYTNNYIVYFSAHTLAQLLFH